MKGKVAVAGISLILVVGVIIGVIATVSRGSGPSASATEHESGGISTGMKAVETLCAPTEFKDACKKTLTPVAQKDGSVNAKDLVQASFEATRDEVKKALSKTGSLGIQLNDEYDKMSLSDCNTFLADAAEFIEKSIIKTSDSQMHTLGDLAGRLNVWLSAVVADYTTCVDQIEHPELKKAMQDLVKNINEMTINGLNIVNEVEKLLSSVNITVPFKLNEKSSRQLGEINETDEHGYPTWLSTDDRRVLVGRNQPVPNVVVAQDGSGQFKTIQAAINAYPKNLKGRYVVYVKAGIYKENVIVPKNAINVFMYGDGPRKTIVTGDRDVAIKKFTTSNSATFIAEGDGFLAKSIAFRNTAGSAGHQAVALRTKSDMAAFFNCRFDAYQDTLYYHAQRSFYRNCIISGTVDFIFGSGSALIQNSKIIVRLPDPGQKNMVTADGRENAAMKTGVVLQNCQIVPDKRLAAHKLEYPTYLGRPWKAAARVMVMQSDLGDLINPEGWKTWEAKTVAEGSNNHLTAEFHEFANRGPGSNTARRVRWPKTKVVTDPREAEQFTAARFFIDARWLDTTGMPHSMGL